MKKEFTSTQRRALIIVLEFVERWNKQDVDMESAEAKEILEEFLKET